MKTAYKNSLPWHGSITSRQTAGGREGSALLLTLLVTSLLLVLALAFVVVVRLELREVTNYQRNRVAQANARLGMQMALANLQQTLGPDQRVSARGEMFDGVNLTRPGVNIPVNKQRWIGVWDATTWNETDPRGKVFLGWLQSSGESGRLPGFDEPAPDPGHRDTILLIGPGSLGEGPTERYRYARRVRWENHAFAWVVEDEGLKAQLATDFRNDYPPNQAYLPGGGLIPGAHKLEGLAGMSELRGIVPDEVERLNSLRDLPLLLVAAGRDPDTIHHEKFYDFTTFSRGVLADVKNGGLKRDLTIAFENDNVFERVFPENNNARYLLLDPDKLSAASDLNRNGYIHWNIFRDYYNLKLHIQERNNREFLDSAYFAKDDLLYGPGPMTEGILAPHNMGRQNNRPRHRQQPYGHLAVTIGLNWQNPPYRHNPIGPLLSTLQQTTWMEYRTPEEGESATTVRLHTQVWSSHYNPYNIPLMVRGWANGGERGPRLINYPQVHYRIPNSSSPEWSREPGRAALGGKREIHAAEALLLGPGQSQIYGVEEVTPATSLADAGPYGPNIARNATAHVYRDYDDFPVLPQDQDVEVEVTFRIDRDGAGTLMHGAGMHPSQVPPGESQPHDMEVAQVLYAPFAWDASNGMPAKKIRRRVSPGELNENTLFTVGFYLRTTREPVSDALRPLIDANIRAPWVNPRWDDRLNLSTAAAYADANDGNPEGGGSIPQMHAEEGKGFSYMGAGRDPLHGSTRVVLFDIPREDLVSLGQLQHAAAGRFSYEPSYIVGNSYANPRIPNGAWRSIATDTFSSRNGLDRKIPGAFFLYDASYLVNQNLWDSYVFTTIPQTRDNHTPGEPEIDYEALADGELSLPNPRFKPYGPGAFIFTASNLTSTGNTEGTRGSFFHNAGFLMVDGAFNVNSTSVDAWEAFLTGTLDLPLPRMDERGLITGFRPVDKVRFPRVRAPYGEGMDREALDGNYWTGFRELEQSEVRALAEAIVERVKVRGPFLSMGEFVNRMLRNDEHGRAGILQAALDATVNHGLDTRFERSAGGVEGNSTQGAGFPGQLLQGDLLQALSPMMQVRSDTFVIRAYGEVNSESNGQPVVRAWAEAVVQRVPDPMSSRGEPSVFLEELAMPSSPFGRQFRVLSFRWLAEDEI